MSRTRFNWAKKRVLVTGGASFIGSHVVDKLVDSGAWIRVVDNLSSGTTSNLKSHLTAKRIDFIKADLRHPNTARDSLKRIDILIHLAGDHGGRGYIDSHQAGPAGNLFIDGLVFWEALNAGVDKVVFASSGCVYPNHMQTNPHQKLFLTEALVTPPYDADNMYGYAKLMSELTLKAYYQEHGLKSASCRFFTVYGPRATENHAVMAMIAKAFIRQNPFQVWGNGQQLRNWTYVDDIVRGVILTTEKIDDGTAINLGTTERITVRNAASEILKYTHHKPRIKFLPHLPTGPTNRVADNTLAKKLLGWTPQVKFIDGLHQTIDWYFSTHNQKQVKENLSRLLMSR